MDDQRDFERYLEVFRKNVTPEELNGMFGRERAPPPTWSIEKILSSVGVAGLVAVGIWVGTIQNQVTENANDVFTLESGRVQSRADRNMQISAMDARLRAVETSNGSVQTDMAAIKALIMQGFGDMSRRLDRLESRP
jgi:hypothetical protein